MEDKATQPPANVNVGLYGPTAHTTPRDEFFERHAAIKLRARKTRQNANAGFRLELVTLAGS
jgi:hypothetical protein